jgi:hypothetical protein
MELLYVSQICCFCERKLTITEIRNRIVEEKNKERDEGKNEESY